MNLTDLKLRAMEPSDVDAIYRWENNPEHWLVSNTIAPMSRHLIDEFVRSENDIYGNLQMRLMVADQADQPIGCVDMFEFEPRHRRVGVGLLIDPSFRDKGVGAMALQRLVDYCFSTLEVNMIFANVVESNKKSMQLFENAGFEKVGVKKQWLWDGERFLDEVLFQKFRSAK